MRKNSIHRSPRSWMWGAIVVLALYPLSLGPACWIVMRLDPWKHRTACRVMGFAYTPVVIVVLNSPRPVKNAIGWYLELGAPKGTTLDRQLDIGIYWLRPGYSYTFLSF